MSPKRVQEFLEAQPFHPMTIYTGDGSTVRVPSREFAWLLPGGRTLFVATGEAENDYDLQWIDVFLITKITASTRGKSNGRGRRSS
jgi:hypothetical protein